MKVRASEVAKGDELPPLSVPLTREDLVRYAGASGDFNPIHYRDDVAARVGLPGVLAHGMLTMGLAIETLVPWLGDSGRILEYGVPERGEQFSPRARTRQGRTLKGKTKTKRYVTNTPQSGEAFLGARFPGRG